MRRYPSYNAISRELVAAISDGDKSAFEAFYRMERNNLVHFCNSFVHDTVVAEDLAQDALLRIWETRDSLDETGNLRALVFTVARNRTIDFLRRRHDAASLEACAGLEGESLSGFIEALDLGELVTKTFDNLPSRVRHTFLLSREIGLTNREIAEMENVSVKSVEYRISVALKKFRKVLNII